MQTLTEMVYKLGPPGGLFDDSVVQNLVPDLSTGAKRLLIHRAAAHGEIQRLKRGHYCLSPEYRKSQPHPFVLAAILHSPSDISLESALSYHGLIPEAVYQVTSVTSRRSRTYETPVGRFSFLRVPAKHPRAGVGAVRMEPNGWAFIASPIRAIADLLYSRKDVRWQSDGIGFLTESMRIEEEDLRAIPLEDIEEVIDSINSKRVRTYLTRMRNEMDR